VFCIQRCVETLGLPSEGVRIPTSPGSMTWFSYSLSATVPSFLVVGFSGPPRICFDAIARIFGSWLSSQDLYSRRGEERWLEHRSDSLYAVKTVERKKRIQVKPNNSERTSLADHTMQHQSSDLEYSKTFRASCKEQSFFGKTKLSLRGRHDVAILRSLIRETSQGERCPLSGRQASKIEMKQVILRVGGWMVGDGQ
jgi:hypothetical protein